MIGNVPVETAGYDPDTYIVNVTPLGPIIANHLVQLTINLPGAPGLRDCAGVLIDGDGDGRPGGTFVAQTGFGDHFRFFDGDGDAVTLNLRGGGTMLLANDRVGNPLSLTFMNVSSRSLLTGSIRPGPGSPGTVVFPVVINLDGVRNRLPAGFSFGVVRPSEPSTIYVRSSPRSATGEAGSRRAVERPVRSAWPSRLSGRSSGVAVSRPRPR